MGRHEGDTLHTQLGPAAPPPPPARERDARRCRLPSHAHTEATEMCVERLRYVACFREEPRRAGTGLEPVWDMVAADPRYGFQPG